MLYNVPLNKRITRHRLIEDLGFDRNDYWGFFEINEMLFRRTFEEGEVNESFIIN
jgi:hypothetical protein